MSQRFYQCWRDHRAGLYKLTLWTNESYRTTSMAWPEHQDDWLDQMRREVRHLRSAGWTPFLRGRR